MHLHNSAASREVRVTAEWSDTAGTVTFTPWGVCSLAADATILTVRIDAADEPGLTQIRDIINRDLDRFSQRNPITVTWQRSDGPGTTVAPVHQAKGLRSHRQTALLVLAVVAIIGLHIALAGTAVAGSRWTGLATDVLVALILVKIVLIVVRVRRRKAGDLNSR
jgi:hypothetical protein